MELEGLNRNESVWMDLKRNNGTGETREINGTEGNE